MEYFKIEGIVPDNDPEKQGLKLSVGVNPSYFPIGSRQ